MIGPEHQIPLPLESAKGSSKLVCSEQVGNFQVQLSEIQEEVFSHKVMVGSPAQSEYTKCLNRTEANILFHLVVHYLKRAKSPADAIWNAEFMMMWRDS